MEPTVPAPTNPSNNNPVPETPRPFSDIQPAPSVAPTTPQLASAPAPEVISPSVTPAASPDTTAMPNAASVQPSTVQPLSPSPISPSPVDTASPARAGFTPPMPSSAPATQLPTDMFADVPAQPAVGQPFVDGTAGAVPPSGYTPSSVGKSPFGRSKLPLLVAAVVAVLVIGGGGFTFAYYLPNRPSSVFSKSLVNSGKAIDTLITYAESQDAQSAAKGANFDGSLKLTSPAVSTDITMKGSYDKDANATANFSADVAGQNVALNLISVHKSGSSNPDLYFQVKGVKSFLDAAGANQFDSLDGQWIAVDHTLLDSYESAASGSAAQANPSAADINDAVTKVQTVNKQYLFTTDPNNAVLVNQKYIGKENMDGVNVDHFQTGYNKDHLKSYLGALKTALDSSKLNDYVKKSGGSSISESLDISSLQTALQSAKPYSFDLYADTSNKLVHAITLKDGSGGNQTVTISQNYKGGNEYPFAIREVSKDTDGNTQDFTVGYTLNTKANTSKFTINGTGTDTTGKTSISGGFNVTPSTAPVQVTAPAGSKSVLDIVNQLGLGSAFSDSGLSSSDFTSTSAKLTTKSPFTLKQ